MSAEVIEGKRVAVIGGGAWGSSISKVLTENGHQVSLWCYLDEEANAVNDESRSLRLEGVVLPKGIEAHTDFASVFKHSPDWMVIALSSSQLEQLEEVEREIEGMEDIDGEEDADFDKVGSMELKKIEGYF